MLALRWALKVKVAIISETMAPLIYYCGIINSSALVKCMTGNKTGRSAFKKKSLYSFNTEGKNNPSVGIFFFRHIKLQDTQLREETFIST